MILFSKTLKSITTACRVYVVHNAKAPLPKNSIELYSTNVEFLPKKSVKSLKSIRKEKVYRLHPSSWLLLVIPVTAFGLGTWQIFRKIEKEKMIKELEKRTNIPPVSIPRNLEELENMEYIPVKVKGTFEHEREIFMGPRSLISPQTHTFAYNSSLLSTSQPGYQVITPFKLADRNLTILVNRGWVPSHQKNPSLRQEGQVKGEVELVGLVRLDEKRPPLGQKNVPDRGFWTYRDLQKMSEKAGSAPILIDATTSTPNGPVGGQTVVALRNDHTTYIATWYGLATCTGYMWWARYLKK